MKTGGWSPVEDMPRWAHATQMLSTKAQKKFSVLVSHTRDCIVPLTYITGNLGDNMYYA